jgi:hypothetical protein
MGSQVGIRGVVYRHYWPLMFRMSKKRDCERVKIGTLLLETKERSVIEEKVCAALKLLAIHDSRHLVRLRAHVAGIFVFGSTQWALGSWIQRARLIRLKESYVADESVATMAIAALIVHETTHAWLEHLGFKYEPGGRQRIEAICFRMEAAFARHVPEGADLAKYSEDRAAKILAEPSEVWSDSAFANRAATELRELGTPKWIVDWLLRFRNRRVA